MAESIDLHKKLETIRQFWHPKIIGEANGQYIKLARCEGELEWHRHREEDEVFLCLEGQLRLEMRDEEVVLNPGELFVVPRGVEHKPHAQPNTSVLLVEPKSTQHLGELESPRAVNIEEQME